MLQADKRALLAGVKKDALELRNKELDFNVERYTNLATQASVMAGFSFESLVELEVPEHTNEYLSSIYFVFGSLAMSLSLYVLCVSSFCCVYGHRLALQGPHGSLERAVVLMVAYRSHIFAAAGVALANLVAAAICMSWIKMGPAAGFVTFVFLGFGFCVSVGMSRMAKIFDIPAEDIVSGSTQVYNPNAGTSPIDLALLNPNAPSATAALSVPPTRGRSPSSTRMGPGAEGGQYTRLAEEPTSDARSGVLHQEGYLYKKAGNSKLSAASRYLNQDSSRRRYFVLRGTKLYYFKAWEAYGSLGLGGALNKNAPIDMLHHIPTIAQEASDGTRFDLVPQGGDAHARKWELQAGTQQDALDWINALRQAYSVAQEAQDAWAQREKAKPALHASL